MFRPQFRVRALTVSAAVAVALVAILAAPTVPVSAAPVVSAPILASPGPPIDIDPFPLPSTVVVSNTGANDSDAVKAIAVSCPDLYPTMYGAGGSHTGGVAVTLISARPWVTGTATAVAVENQATSVRWSLTVTAVCGRARDGYEIVARASGAALIGAAPAVASCSPGNSLYGTGFTIVGGAGLAALDSVVPGTALTSVTVSAWSTNAAPSGWSVTAVAVCASSAGTPSLVVTPGPDDSDPAASATTTGCPVPGERVTGAGGDVQGLSDPTTPFIAMLTGLTPGTTTATADGASTSWWYTWGVVAYAICA